MSQSSATATVEQTSVQWRALCSRADLVANSGVVAWVDGAQVALFYLPDETSGKQLYAVDNRDPKSGANVIGRGIVGSLGGDLVIAAPLSGNEAPATTSFCKICVLVRWLSAMASTTLGTLLSPLKK